MQLFFITNNTVQFYNLLTWQSVSAISHKHYYQQPVRFSLAVRMLLQPSTFPPPSSFINIIPGADGWLILWKHSSGIWMGPMIWYGMSAIPVPTQGDTIGTGITQGSEFHSAALTASHCSLVTPADQLGPLMSAGEVPSTDSCLWEPALQTAPWWGALRKLVTVTLIFHERSWHMANMIIWLCDRESLQELCSKKAHLKPQHRSQ